LEHLFSEHSENDNHLLFGHAKYLLTMATIAWHGLAMGTGTIGGPLPKPDPEFTKLRLKLEEANSVVDQLHASCRRDREDWVHFMDWLDRELEAAERFACNFRSEYQSARALAFRDVISRCRTAGKRPW
jgi:hypothetical protein